MHLGSIGMQQAVDTIAEVVAIQLPRQEGVAAAVPEVEPVGEVLRCVGRQAQVPRAHVEHMLRARLAVGHAATVATVDADQMYVRIGRCAALQCRRQRHA